MRRKKVISSVAIALRLVSVLTLAWVMDGQLPAQAASIELPTPSLLIDAPMVTAGQLESVIAPGGDYTPSAMTIPSFAGDCDVPLTGVSLDGPTSGDTGETLTFTACLQPSGATPPVNYIWSSDGLVGGRGDSQASYRWADAGDETVQVTAYNCGGQGFGDELIVSLDYRVFLSLVYRSRSTVLTVCPAGPPTCDYAAVQAAVDAAGAGDTIKVAAGTYTDVSVRPRADVTITGVVTQVVYVDESVTIRGGYTTSNWATPDPEANPTVLDAQGRGRVFYVTGDVDLTIEGLRITGGDATGLGGRLLEEPKPPVTIEDNQVFSNTTAYEGGGLYAVNATVTAANNQVRGNVVTSLGGTGNGGGLFLHESDVTLTGNTFISNVAYAGGGGGLYLYSGEATLTGNTFVSNSAFAGGGLCLDSKDAVLTGNTFTGNTAGRGGGLVVYGDDVILDGNTVSGNTANTGGGICLSAADGARLDGNVVVSNTANTGGGLYMWLNNDVVLTNDVVADNSGGSGLYIEASSPRLLHTTIARNGSGIYVTDYSSHYSTVVLTNTIVASHTVGITVAAGNTATLHTTLWYANTTDWSGNVTHTDDYSGDPAFAADGYHLTFGSAAIDEGVDTGVYTDIDGDVRPAYGLSVGYDLGADEFYRR